MDTDELRDKLETLRQWISNNTMQEKTDLNIETDIDSDLDVFVDGQIEFYRQQFEK